MKTLKVSFAVCLICVFVQACTDRGAEAPYQSAMPGSLGKVSLSFDDPPGGISEVVATLTRSGFSTRTMQLTISDSLPTATGSFTNVEPGVWHLRVEARDSSHFVRYSGETEVNVQAGQTTQVTLQLVAGTGGGIQIIVTWGTVPLPVTGLVACYPFNGNTNDTSGGGHHGVLYGAILTTDRFGHSNSAYMFDGVNDYVDIPNTNNWNFTPGFTLVAWANFSQSIVDAIIVGKHNWGSYNGYALNVFNSRHCFYVSSDPRISAPQQSNDGLWHMVAGVYNGQTQYLYLDGVLVNNRVVAYTNTNTTNVRIGAANIAGYFAGKIDDVRMYNRPLSSSEIQGLYHEGGW